MSMKRRHKRSQVLPVGIAIFASATGSVYAQSNTANVSDNIVVTGSRVERTGFTTPNPITVVDADLTESLGIVNVSETLELLPQNSSYISATNAGRGPINIGAEVANLRGLNPYYGTRTLTLVDTRRHVPTTNTGSVDSGVIPSMLVKRVEVVTGGATAAYGSDAVAGVVNILLDHELEGFKGQVDYGQTFRNDGGNEHGSFAFGTRLLDDRAHVMFGIEYQKQHSIDHCSTDRAWCAESWAEVVNPNYTGASPNGLPNYVISPNVKLSDRTTFGVFPSGAAGRNNPAGLQNTRFNEAGTAVLDFDRGDLVTTGTFGQRIGGDGDNVSPYYYSVLMVPTERLSAYGRAQYDFNDSTSMFAEVSYASRDSVRAGGSFGPNNDVIYPDNVYLTPAVQALFGTQTFALFTKQNDYPSPNFTDNTTWRGTLGFEGELPFNEWRWDAYVQFGDHKTSQVQNNVRVQDNTVATGALVGGGATAPTGTNNFYRWALDAVDGDPGPGVTPVCRITLTNPGLADDCVPMNVFGDGSNTDPAAIAYATRTLMEDFTYKQQVYAANVRGDLFEGFGAGPVGAAFGVEYRHEKGDVEHFNLPYYNQFVVSYGEEYAGKIDVIEGYGEFNLPLLRDAPIAESLEANFAVRYTHNKTENPLTGDSASNSLTSWKISAVWDPTSWLRVRATRSRDGRAASFRDLYARSLQVGGFFGTLTNPWNADDAVPANVSDPSTVLTGGNVDARPEKADTTTLGFVLQPEGVLQGFRLSVDWFEVDLKDAITSGGLGAQTIVDQCYSVSAYCDRIEGVSDGAGGFNDITFIDNGAVNLGSVTSRGVDIEAAYLLPLGDMSESLAGDVTFRVLATYLYDTIVDPGNGGSVVNWAGQTGPGAYFANFNPSPKWNITSWLGYRYGGFQTTLQMNYIDSGVYNYLRTGPQDAGFSNTSAFSISDNRVKSRAYFNLSATYDIPFGEDRSVQLFGTIYNLFDKAPPVAPNITYPTNPVLFDTLGARFRAGVRVKF
ncbi:MAG: TonB-dependent receptor [Gammaproteobacteria bacterium]|nr:TonB-dependent receptor [Gammaproteobacteria bacterium]